MQGTTQNTPQSTNPTSLHPDTHLGMLALTVSDLSRSLIYYREALGFQVLKQGEGEALLGALDGRPLLHLTEQKGATEWPRGGRSYTGLYHFAILVPSREDLGRWLRHWLGLGLPHPGQADHLVSEALYLEDPDGHGIEIYRDRPREEWPRVNGQIQMAADPLDIPGILADAERDGKPWEGMPPGTTLGHMHLQVSDIPQAQAFYCDVLGFEVIVVWHNALFISAGGYHHHIGMNTWHSRGMGPAPADSVNLQHFTIHLPDESALAPVLARLDAAGIPYTRDSEKGKVIVQDPWRNTLHLVPHPAA
jgi:catechol 2,3-dioxygenase